MRSIILTRSPQGSGAQKRNEIENELLRITKIKMVAYKGGFDKYCNKWQISRAKEGICPNNFEVHHIIPLNCTNTEITLDNMVVVENKAHSWLHTNIYNPALQKCNVGQDCMIFIPDIDREQVLTWSMLLPFVHSFERQRKRDLLLKKSITTLNSK